MGLIKFLREGSWSLWSDSDPRWNTNGRSDSVGMGGTPPEAQAALTRLTDLYGDPPDDLELSTMKD